MNPSVIVENGYKHFAPESQCRRLQEPTDLSLLTYKVLGLLNLYCLIQVYYEEDHQNQANYSHQLAVIPCFIIRSSTSSRDLFV